MSETLYRLRQFVDAFNSGELQIDFDAMHDQLAQYSSEVIISYKNQFCNRDKRTHIGLSEIGKPAVLLGLKKLGVAGEIVSPASRLRFHFGDVFESLILATLKAHNFSITMEQHEISMKGTLGHIDAVVNDDTVLEVKTMSDYYYQKFIKEPDDSRGYVTQLNTYAYMLCKKGVWLCLNKQTYQLALIELVPNPLVLERAEAVIKALKEVKVIDDVLDLFDPPEPEAEFFKKQPTGRYLIPASMKYAAYLPVFYDLVLDVNGYKKPTTYVTSFPSKELSIKTFYNLKEGLVF